MGDPTPQFDSEEEPLVERIRDGSSRWYTHRTRLDEQGNPKRYLSVTTVLQGVAKAALVHWAGHGAAGLAMAELPKLIQAARRKSCEGSDKLTRCGVCIDCTTRWVGDWSDRKSGESRERGTRVHRAIDFWVRTGTWGPAEDDIEPYLDAYRKFIEDHGITLDDFERAEAIVLHDEHEYAGTLDAELRIHASRTPAAAELVAKITGWPDGAPLTIVDVKTREAVGDPRFFQDMSLQLVAYNRCPVWVDKNDWIERPRKRADGGFVLQLRPDGYAVQPVVIDDNTWQGFLGYMQGYRWTLEFGARSVGVKSFPLPNEMQDTQAGQVRAMVARGILEGYAKRAAAAWAKGDHDGAANALRLASRDTATPPPPRGTPAKKAARKATKKAPAPSSMPTATGWGSLAGDQPATYQQVPLEPEKPARPVKQAAPRIAGATLDSLTRGPGLANDDIPF